jgi:HlyD family secretion protein
LTQAQATANNTSAQTQVNTAQSQLNQAQAQATSNNTSAQTQVNTAQNQLGVTQTQSATNNNTAASQVSTNQQQLGVTQAAATANASTAQGQINTAQKQLNTTQANGNASNTTAQGQVSSSQSGVNTALANGNASNTAAQGTALSAQDQLNAALINLQTAKHNLDTATLRAPHDGIVTTINGTVGGTPGVPTNSNSVTSTPAAPGSTFIQIVDVNALQVQANVNESDVGNLRVGQPATFTVSAYPTKVFRGIVSAIAPYGTIVSNVVTYPVTIDVDMSHLQGATLLPTMTANVTITVVQRLTVLLIPVSAVNFARNAVAGTTQGGPLISRQEASSALAQARQMLNQLEVQNPDIQNDNPNPSYVLERSGNRFVIKPVVLGLTDETVYEVLAGLSPNEVIVVGALRG